MSHQLTNRVILLASIMCAVGCGHQPVRHPIPEPATYQVSTAATNQDPPSTTPLSTKDWLRIRKADRQLYLYRGSKIIERYPIALGYSPIGAKDRRDDYKTPEGIYYLCQRNPRSHYYRALRISYPNVTDGERCMREGLITARELTAIRQAINHHSIPPQNTRAGGDILIHGGGVGKDWTWGCVALDNANMKKLYDTLAVGTSVLIEK